MKLSSVLPLLPLAAAAPSHLVERVDENRCSPTGRESCNFWLKAWQNDPTIHREYNVYDYDCRSLTNGDRTLASTHTSITSQLPYTVELDLDASYSWPNGFFWYAGRQTLFRDAYCVDCGEGKTFAQCCRVAFKCH